MKLFICEFRSRVEEEYGAAVANAFAQQFANDSVEIPFEHGMEVLDRVLMNQVKPAIPFFGRTTSLSGDGELQYIKK